MCGTRKCYSAPVVDYRRCLSPCRRRVPCIPVRLILILSSYCIPVSFALFDHFLLGSGCLGLFAFSSRLVSPWFSPGGFYSTDSKGAKECKCKTCRFFSFFDNNRPRVAPDADGVERTSRPPEMSSIENISKTLPTENGTFECED